MAFLVTLRTSLAMHALLELPAAFVFYFKPSTHLPAYPSDLTSRPPTDLEVRWVADSEPIRCSYGILLLSSSLIAAVAAHQDMPPALARAIALFLAVYRIGPIQRACARIARNDTERAQGPLAALQSPYTHLLLHSVVGQLLLMNVIMGCFL